MARYRDAVQWIANNTTGQLVGEDDLFADTIELTAHLFGKPSHHVALDVLERRGIDRRRHQREIDAEYDEEDRMMDVMEMSQ